MNADENQIVVYQPNETVRLDVRLENETVWLTQLKIADLSGVQKVAISKHIKNIFASGELIKEATVSKMETVQAEGGRTVVRVQTKEPPLQGVFYQGRYWDAKSLLIKFIRWSRRRRGQDGRRNHPWTPRLDPQGDIGAPRIWQAA